MRQRVEVDNNRVPRFDRQVINPIACAVIPRYRQRGKPVRACVPMKVFARCRSVNYQPRRVQSAQP